MYLHGNEELPWHLELFNYQGALCTANVKTVSAFLGQSFIFRAIWPSQKWSPGLEHVIYIREDSSLTPISIDSSKQISNLNVRHHDEVSTAKAKCPPSGRWLPSLRNCKWSHTPFADFKACQSCCLSEWHSENFLKASKGTYDESLCPHRQHQSTAGKKWPHMSRNRDNFPQVMYQIDLIEGERAVTEFQEPKKGRTDAWKLRVKSSALS